VNTNNASAVARELARPLRDLFGIQPGDGFAPEMIELIMELQTSLGVFGDGIIGDKTAAALKRQGYLEGSDCSGVWAPDSAAPLERRAHYLELFARRGGNASSARPCLLGIRGAYPFARRSHKMIHARRFDDSFVLITDADAIVFRGATHAYQLSLATSTGAVASIQPGVFVLTLAGSTPPIYNLTLPNGSGNIPAFRDHDHNGVISADEMKIDLAANGGSGAIATEIQFHPGYDTIKTQGHSFSSIGCQTAPLAELQLLERAGHTIDYVLANVGELNQGAIANA
jgi:hypothetical protein